MTREQRVAAGSERERKRERKKERQEERETERERDREREREREKEKEKEKEIVSETELNVTKWKVERQMKKDSNQFAGRQRDRQ